MPAPRTRRVAMEYALSNGDIAVNTFHVRNDVVADFTAAEAALIAASFEGFWEDIRAEIANNVTLQNINVRDASGVTGLSFNHTPTNPAGTETTDPLPYQIALVSTIYTALNSRSGRGRVYLCGFGEVSNTSTGFCVSTTVSAIQTAWSNLIGALSVTDHEVGVFSRTLNQFNPATSINVNSTWDTQRRRNRP